MDRLEGRGGMSSLSASSGARQVVCTFEATARNAGDSDSRAMTTSRDRSLQDPFEELYTALRRIAAQRLAGDRQRREVDPTDLVHECYLRLKEIPGHDKLPREELLAICATIIRNVLVDRARESKSRKRGGDLQRIELSVSLKAKSTLSVDVLDFDSALRHLAELDARQARIVELRIFGGLALDEIARLLVVSPRTIDANWAMARAWLKRELGNS